MSASRSCPTCGKQWTDTFKFCPEDGTLLVELRAPSDTVVTVAPTFDLPSSAGPARASSPPSSPPADSPPSPMDAVEAALERMQSAGAKAPRKTASRLLNIAPAEAAGARAPAEAPKARRGGPEAQSFEEEPPFVHEAIMGAVRDVNLRAAPTVLTPAVTEAILQEARGKGPRRITQSQTPKAPGPITQGPAPKAAERITQGPAPKAAERITQGPAPKASGPTTRGPAPRPITRGPAAAAPRPTTRGPAPTSPRATTHGPVPAHKKTVPPVKEAGADAGKGGKRKAGEFSETAWFMRPVQAVDPETGSIQADPKIYRRDETIPEEKRRRFSLRRKDEE